MAACLGFDIAKIVGKNDVKKLDINDLVSLKKFGGSNWSKIAKRK